MAVDADALDMYERLKSYYGDAWRDAQKEIDNAPTVDAVPVIRCKDCKKSHSTSCPIDDGLSVSESFYCAWAERKEE